MGKKSTRKGLLLVAIIIGVGLIIAGIVVAVEYFRDDEVDDPTGLTMSITVDGEEHEVTPYRVCELGKECTEDESNILQLPLGEQQVADVTVPQAVAESSWVVQRFYADETLNGSETHNPGTATEVKISGSESVGGQRSPLAVLEVSTASIIGVDDAGEETIYGVTWSVANSNVTK